MEIMRDCAKNALEMFAEIYVTEHDFGQFQDEVKEVFKSFQGEVKEQIDIVLKNFWDDLETIMKVYKKELSDELKKLKEALKALNELKEEVQELKDGVKELKELKEELRAELRAEFKAELKADLKAELKLVQDELGASQKEIMRLSKRQETFEVETQKTHAELRSDANAFKAEVNDLTWSFQDLKTQEIDELYKARDFETKTEIAFGHLRTSIEEIHSELGKQQIILEDVQVDVAEATIDTSHLEDEQVGLDSRFETFTQRIRLMTKSTIEYGAEARVSQLGDQEQHHELQPHNQVFDHHMSSQDFESEHEIEVSDFTHRVETHDDNQAMMDVQDHESVTLHDHDQEMNDVEDVIMWLDDNGDLQTNSHDLDDDWDELNAIWDTQKAKFEARMETEKKGKLDWLHVDFNKYSVKCLWSAIFSRTHSWTTSNAGKFACKACANNRVICFGNNNGRWEALPLPDKVLEDNPSIKQKYISFRNTISKSRQALGVWPDT